jgi:hypothetical protein
MTTMFTTVVRKMENNSFCNTIVLQLIKRIDELLTFIQYIVEKLYHHRLAILKLNYMCWVHVSISPNYKPTIIDNKSTGMKIGDESVIHY